METTHESKGLCGDVAVADIEYYVEQHPDIAFIVLKEHECGPTQRPRGGGRPFLQRDNEWLSERKEVIQIVSTVLNDALKRIAEFEPYDVRIFALAY
ncbi:hypothetical protein PG996_011800 [Apiospora saccharicola]|uniref:Uncharacterized protein n=1 Tax=Apiospora saccharicola TaxID=335842 RepID=A0ABR1UG29_9PEZI